MGLRKLPDFIDFMKRKAICWTVGHELIKVKTKTFGGRAVNENIEEWDCFRCGDVEDFGFEASEGEDVY